MLKFQLWAALENGRTNIGWVRDFSGTLPGQRGCKLKDQFLKIANLKKVAQEGYLKCLSPLLDTWPPQSCDGSLSNFFDPAQVRFLLLGFELVWVWKFSPKNPKFFSFLPFGSKKSHLVGSKTGQPLNYCGSKVCSGRVSSAPISTPISGVQKFIGSSAE